MIGRPRVVLDACVLANFSLCDTLLRCAETPRLFEPKWSLRASFPEARVTGHEPLVLVLQNDEKDRHVLAAAIHCQASGIVTFNLRHFTPEHTQLWNIEAIHPQSFLVRLLREEHLAVLKSLQQQAADRKRSPRELLRILSRTVPEFAATAELKFIEAGLIAPTEA